VHGGLFGDLLLDERGAHVAGTHAIARHTERAALESRDLREPLEAVLGGDVCALERRCPDAVNGRHIDDAPEVALVHSGERRADQQEWGLEHERDDSPEVARVEVLDRAHPLDARVVDEDVHAIEFAGEGVVGESLGVEQVDLPRRAADLRRHC
jgi:hypothetical protein